MNADLPFTGRGFPRIFMFLTAIRGRVCAGAIALLALAPVLAASGALQRQPGPAAPTPAAGSTAAEPSARVVQIDAVVTDRQGRPILDLRPSDFEVVEDGVVQKLNAAELRTPSAAPQGGVEPVESPADEERAARQPGTRVIALLLDEFHVAAGPSSDAVRDALLGFVEQEVRPADLLTVLRPLDPVTEIRFTRDREAALRAIRDFTGRKGSYEPRTEFEEKYIGRAPAAVRAARAQIVLSGLRALVARLDELHAGRAAVVLVSEGVTPSPRGSERRVPDLQGLVRAASRSHVSIYTLNPGDPAAPVSDVERDPGREFLQAVAIQTGGEAAMSPAAFQPALRRVSRDLDGYYVLSYASSHGADSRFYGVEVRTTRPDARVRARSGYWAPMRTSLLRGPESAGPPRRVIRRSPLIDTWLGLTVTPDGVQHVTFTWEPAEVRSRAAAAFRRPAAVAVKVTTPEGAVLFEGEIAPPRGGLATGRQDAAYFEAAPGRLQFDLTIAAADGTRIDTAAQDVDVPDVGRADPLILPPQVFRSSSAREFREISGDPSAAPVPARAFRRTERLLVRVPTYSRAGAPVAVAVRVLSRSGQMLRELVPMPASASQAAAQFDLPLAWLAPSEYSLDVTATTAAGTAREIVRFRVTG